MGGLDNFGPFIDEIDKRNKRILMEEEYDLLQKQKKYLATITKQLLGYILMMLVKF